MQVEDQSKDKLVEAKQRLEGLRLQKDEEVCLYEGDVKALLMLH